MDGMIDQGREATAVRDGLSFIDNAESLLNELSGSFDEQIVPGVDQTSDRTRLATAHQEPQSFIDDPEPLAEELSRSFDEQPTPPKPPQPPVVEEAVATPQEIPLTSPPRIEPPVMIWKPSRRARFRFRLR